MTSGTRIRVLGRFLDAADRPVWVIGGDGRLVYLSAATAAWLGREVQPLVDRRSIAGAAVSDDPLDRIAASLSAPPGFAARGTASLKLQPPLIDGNRPPSMDVRFIRVGDGDDAVTIAIGGQFDDRVVDPDLNDAVALRGRLDAWRRHHATIATIATAGESTSAKRLRRRLKVASATRIDIAILGPRGCGGESVANRIHQLSAAGEPLVVVDGPLMDAELLDATLSSLVNRLSDASSATGTALLRGLDEMPLDAQARLAELYDGFNGRLRLIAVCKPQLLKIVVDSNEHSSPTQPIAWDEQPTHGLTEKLVEILSSLVVTLDALSTRIEDVPLLATAFLDLRRAAGEGQADRISRGALDALVVYPWPGDVDELDAAIRHAIRAATGPAITVEHLPLAIRTYRPGHQPPRKKNTAVSLDQAVSKYERRLIQDAIEAADGNRAEAARRLGISRSRLLRKLDEAAKTATDPDDQT